MPLRTPTDIISFGGWVRGLNHDASELQVSIEEAPSALNVDFDRRGGFKPRDGIAQEADVTGMDDEIQYMFPYTPSSGTDTLICIEETGDIWMHTGNAPITPTSQSVSLGAHSGIRTWPIEAAMLDDQVYIFTLRGNTRRYDGSTWTEITDTTLNESGTAASPEAPRAATATTHMNRIFAGNIYDGANRRSRIMWSETPVDNSGDAAGNRWKATSFIDVSEDDGTEVRKVASFQSNLVIFKDHSIHVLAGVDEASFALYPADFSVGTVSPQSVALDETSMYFFDRDSGVYYFDGVKATRIDQAINEYLLDNLIYQQSYKAKGFLSNGKYHLSVPWKNNQNERTFVFDPVTGAWTEYDIGFFSYATWKGLEYVGGPQPVTTNDGVFSFHQGDTSDAGDAIPWHLETAWVPPPQQQGMTEHRLRRADLWVEVEDNVSFTVDLYINGDFVAVKSYTVTPDRNRIKLPGHPKYWSRMKFRFSGSQT